MKKEAPSQAIFAPAMDWWLAAAVFFVIVLLISCIPIIAWQPLLPEYKVLAVCALIITLLYLIDLAFFSRYFLEKDGLLIRSQLRSSFFSYREMLEIRPGGITGLISRGNLKRFALSANCLVINLKPGASWRRITVSPKDSQGFVNQLLQRIDRERTHRASKLHET